MIPEWPVTLKRQILLWMLVVALVPLVILTIQGYYQARQTTTELQEVNWRAFLELKKARLESWLNEAKSEIMLLAADPSVRESCTKDVTGGLSPSIRESFAQHFDLNTRAPHYEAITIFDGHLNAISGVTRCAKGKPASFPADFREALAGTGSDVVCLVKSENCKNQCIFVGAPVADSSGLKKGYVGACLNPVVAAFPIMQDRSGLGRTGLVYIVNTTGDFVLAPAGSESQRGQAAKLPSSLLTSTPSPLEAFTDFRGVPVLGVSTRVGGIGWVLVAQIDREEAYQPSSAIRNSAIITGLVTLLLVHLLSVWLARWISRPARELAAVARRISAGAHQERLQPSGGCEAREVAAAFNKMLDELEANKRRLVQTASLAAVGEVAAGVVHEIRNPLTSVKMNLQALHNKVQDDPLHAELAEIALQQTGRIEAMLADFLSFGRPLQLKIEPVRFGALAKEVCELATPEAQAKGISFEIDEQLNGASLRADSELFRRMLTNLVANAVQASPESGRVRVSCVPMSSTEVAISVTDGGPGFSDSVKMKLFQPFFTTKPGGIGLGLANVKKIAEYHGGHVYAVTAPGHGAEFTVILPLGGGAA